MNPRQPFRRRAVETVAIPIRLQDNGLGDAVKGTLLRQRLHRLDPGGGFTTCRQMP